MTTPFGALLRATRKQACLGQRELAAATGLDFTYLSKIENGHMTPSSSATLALAEALGADPLAFWEAADNVPVDIYKAQIDQLRQRVNALEASLKAAGLTLYAAPAPMAEEAEADA